MYILDNDFNRKIFVTRRLMNRCDVPDISDFSDLSVYAVYLELRRNYTKISNAPVMHVKAISVKVSQIIGKFPPILKYSDIETLYDIIANTKLKLYDIYLLLCSGNDINVIKALSKLHSTLSIDTNLNYSKLGIKQVEALVIVCNDNWLPINAENIRRFT